MAAAAGAAAAGDDADDDASRLLEAAASPPPPAPTAPAPRRRVATRLLALLLALAAAAAALGGRRLRRAARAATPAPLAAWLWGPRVAALGGCPPVALGAAFASRPPTVWLWWTRPTRADMAVEAGAPSPGESTAWLMREMHASVLRHAAGAFDVAVVNASTAPLSVFPLPSYFSALPINHQGDFGSMALLAEHGGLYLDADVLVLHPLRPLLALLERTEFVGYGGHNRLLHGVHHGFMLARPRSAFAVRGYASALRAYERVGGCSQARGTCATPQALGWLGTLEAFEPAAEDARAPVDGLCRLAVLPARFFEPGLAEHEDLCRPAYTAVFGDDGGGGGGTGGGTGGGNASVAALLLGLEAPDADPASWWWHTPGPAELVVRTLEGALSGRLRTLHMSGTKWGHQLQHPDWRRPAPLLQRGECPLLQALLDVSAGEPGKALGALQRVTARYPHVWPQRVLDFVP